MSAQREEFLPTGSNVAPGGACAGGTPPVPVKSLSDSVWEVVILIHRWMAIVFSMLSLLAFSCSTQPAHRNRLDENAFPSLVLWAWERPEDLEFLDSKQFAVAFLAQTVVLKGDEVIVRPRLQPLRVAPQTKLIAVTRMESVKTTGEQPSLSATQKELVIELVLKTLQRTNVSAIQIDYDVTTSEREFYRQLLHELRKRMPDNVALSMTALASFCLGDRWLGELPVDEAVPMIFRMGADDKAIKNLLAGGEDFREPLCRQSYGVAVDEPVTLTFRASRRRYVFNPRPWTKDAVASLESH